MNEIFNTDFTDYVFNSPEQKRTEILDEFWHTNYAAPDLVLIEQIFNVFYQQKVSGIERHRFLERGMRSGKLSLNQEAFSLPCTISMQITRERKPMMQWCLPQVTTAIITNLY